MLFAAAGGSVAASEYRTEAAGLLVVASPWVAAWTPGADSGAASDNVSETAGKLAAVTLRAVASIRLAASPTEPSYELHSIFASATAFPNEAQDCSRGKSAFARSWAALTSVR